MRSRLTKYIHEIRDPIHVFVRLDSDERKVLDSRPFQRLRHIHQLALTYLIYPGATHRRFEHSLGVMELASRVFDIVTHPNNISNDVRNLIHEYLKPKSLSYWRTVLRMAALCHDVGHLPFSHAAEKSLLPSGWDHERITRSIIESKEMKGIWDSLTPPIRPDDIVKLAVGPDKATDLEFSVWETVLSEIITGDAFGVDRIDYLLRDSHHTGVGYGRFDHYRLVDTLRILPSSRSENEPALGVEEGGLHSAEALMLARYFMYVQVYFHPVRRIYDIHLKDFLDDWLDTGQFSTSIDEHLRMTDNEVTSGLLDVARDKGKKGYRHAERILNRKHFRLLYENTPGNSGKDREAGRLVFNALSENFDADQFKHDVYYQKSGAPDFPVIMRSGKIESSLVRSETLQNIPPVSIDNVYADKNIYKRANEWLDKKHAGIIQQFEMEKQNG